MKKLKSLVKILLILGITTNTASAEVQKFFVYKTTKIEAVDSFIAKFASDKHNWIVARSPVLNQKAKIEPAICGDCQLFFVEYPDLKTKSLKEEIFRDGRIGFVVTKADQNEHTLHLHNPKIYLRKISDLMEVSATNRNNQIVGTDRGFKAPPTKINIKSFARITRVLSGAEAFKLDGKSKVISERGSKSAKEMARIFLSQELTKLGAKVSEEKYRSGVNLIATLEGKNKKSFVVVSGHLDSVFNSGADDDASGVATAFAIVEAMHKQKLNIGIKFIAFDEEEKGLVGSRALADSWSKSGKLKEILAVLNIEMTGYDQDNDGAMHAIHCNENSSKDVADLVLQAIKAQNLDLSVVKACTNRSDHASFWRHDVPAIVVSQNFFGRPADSNPCYHKKCDKVDLINFSYAERLANALNGTVWNLVR